MTARDPFARFMDSISPLQDNGRILVKRGVPQHPKPLKSVLMPFDTAAEPHATISVRCGRGEALWLDVGPPALPRVVRPGTLIKRAWNRTPTRRHSAGDLIADCGAVLSRLSPMLECVVWVWRWICGFKAEL